MTTAEFEEKSYEAPLYNQLERGNRFIYTPGQVLESVLGFDRGLLLAQHALWDTLGYREPLMGAALAYYDWPSGFGPVAPRSQLPRFRLNLFLQAKRSDHYKRKPTVVKSISSIDAPLWSFRIQKAQHELLEKLESTLGKRAHVTYAAPAFHTNAALFLHTRQRSIVQNSSFPTVTALSGHTRWYFDKPGAEGVVNPDAERIEELPLLTRLIALASESQTFSPADISWLDLTARGVIAASSELSTEMEGIVAQFFDDLHTLERLAEIYRIRPSLLSYSQISLFAIRFDIDWLLVADGWK